MGAPGPLTLHPSLALVLAPTCPPARRWQVSVHLELIKSVRELSVTQSVELVAAVPRESWRRWLQVHSAWAGRLEEGRGGAHRPQWWRSKRMPTIDSVSSMPR